MTTLEREFYRTQREAGIHFAPWADNAELQRAAGVAIGIIIVAAGSAVIMAVFAGLLRLLVGAA